MLNSNVKLKGFKVDLIKISERPRGLYEVRISKHNKSVSIVCNLLGIQENLDNILKELEFKYSYLLKSINKDKKRKRARCIHCNSLITIELEETTSYCKYCEGVISYQ